ncbi:MAG: hypothetical protein ACM3PP_09535 [Candidatus Saccharibacteria bacterium]
MSTNKLDKHYAAQLSGAIGVIQNLIFTMDHELSVEEQDLLNKTTDMLKEKQRAIKSRYLIPELVDCQADPEG